MTPAAAAAMLATQDKQRWSDLTGQSESDNGQHPDTRNSDIDVERTLKSLNGYHEEILEALQASAHGLAQHEAAMRAAQPSEQPTGRPSPGGDSKKAFTDSLADYSGMY